MSQLLLALALLLTVPALAQTAPATRASQPATPATPAGRAEQYYHDYLERLRSIYFAPGDPRATALLSTTTEELSARRRALRAELTASKSTAAAAPGLAWQQELAALNKTPQAAKFLDRCRRNPALETAYQRFLDARLEELLVSKP